MTAPTVFDLADALHQLADLVGAGNVQGGVVTADPWQTGRLIDGMTQVRSARGPDGNRRRCGWLMDQWLVITEVPALTADQLAAAILTPDAAVTA